MHRTSWNPLHVLTVPLALVKVMLTYLLGWIIPARARRIIMAASLYTHLCRIDPNELHDEELRDYLHEINRLFNLVSREDRALLMPLILHDVIWNGVDLPDEQSLSKRTVQYNTEALLSKVPSWLRYDPKVMLDDISMIVRRCAGRNLRAS